MIDALKTNYNILMTNNYTACLLGLYLLQYLQGSQLLARLLETR